MIITRRDKVMAFIIIFFLFVAFMSLAWLSKTGGFQILADVLKKGL
jgi:hypothetical protein